MTKEELYGSLDYVNHSRERRQQMSDMLTADPKMVQPLLEIAIAVNDPISSRACWVLEFSAKKNLAYVLPYIDLFADNLKIMQLESSIRPMAKICEMLIKAYYSKAPNNTQKLMKPRHLELITTACFDWLIGDHKVAAQAYSMTSLLLLGNTFDWIHPELKLVLEQNYAAGSAAYKARARMTLAKIK